MRRIATALLTLVCALSSLVTAFGQSPPANATVTVPRLIQITGVFQPVDGQPPSAVEIVTLSVYTDAEGGLPVWQERQTVAIEKTTGRFTLLLGASDPAGIPAAVFASGDGQWMSLLFERAGEREQARVRIASVPYALKASDAETLGGLPASAYLRAPTTASTESVRETSTLTSAAVTEGPSLAAVLPGTTNYLAKYVNGGADVGNSAVYETPTAAVPTGAVGIGTNTLYDLLNLRVTNFNGGLTGLAVQNLGNSATSYSGMLFYDHTGALAQFQGFSNGTHEYRINNIATSGSINFMLGGASKFKVDSVGATISAPVDIFTGAATFGLEVFNTAPAGQAIVGYTETGLGIHGFATSGGGVQGSTDTGAGVTGFASTSGDGVFGISDTGAAIAAVSENVALGWAGYFDGDAAVTGTLFKGAGAFRIDHPLDPENMFLVPFLRGIARHEEHL